MISLPVWWNWRLVIKRGYACLYDTPDGRRNPVWEKVWGIDTQVDPRKPPRAIHHDSVLGNEQDELNEKFGTRSVENKVQTTFDEICQQGLLEDRREYGDEDLQEMYGLSGQQAQDLHYLIQRQFDPVLHPEGREGRDVDPFKTCDAEKLKEGIEEALHGGLDGWESEHDRLTIERFVDDVLKYAMLELPAHAKLDRAGVVKALKESGYDTGEDIQSVKFVKMSSGVAIYEVTYYDNDDGEGTGDVYLEVVDGVIKGEF